MSVAPPKRLTPEQEAHLSQCQLVAAMLWARLGGEVVQRLEGVASAVANNRNSGMRRTLLRALFVLPAPQLAEVKRMAGPFAAKNQLLIDLGRRPHLQNVAKAAHDVHGAFVSHRNECRGVVSLELRPITDDERTKTLDEAIAWCMAHEHALGSDSEADDSDSSEG